MQNIRISIICPCYNEEKYIHTLIESILTQTYNKELIEIIFIDGRSSDKTRSIIEKYQLVNPNIKLISNPQKFTPHALNLGINESNGQYIIRIDAHSKFPKNYLTNLIEEAIKFDTDNIGGICNTDVLNKTPKTLAIKEVLSHPFGVGNSHFRTGVKEPVETDTVPFGCFKRDIFYKIGLYNEKLLRNQDIELNKRIKHYGGKIILSPKIEFTYYARETFFSIIKNNFQNGKWNILTVYFTKNTKSISSRHIIPLLFVSSLLFPIILSLFQKELIFISILSFCTYILFLIYNCLNIIVKKNINILFLISSFVLLHLSYGVGSLLAIFNLPLIHLKNIKFNTSSCPQILS